MASKLRGYFSHKMHFLTIYTPVLKCFLFVGQTIMGLCIYPLIKTVHTTIIFSWYTFKKVYHNSRSQIQLHLHKLKCQSCIEADNWMYHLHKLFTHQRNYHTVFTVNMDLTSLKRKETTLNVPFAMSQSATQQKAFSGNFM